LPRAGGGARRSAGFERILRLAAFAFPIAQDAVDDPWVCNKRDDLHAGAAGADGGSASKIFLSRCAHVPRASPEKSKLSYSGCVFAAPPAI